MDNEKVLRESRNSNLHGGLISVGISNLPDLEYSNIVAWKIAKTCGFKVHKPKER